MMIWRSCTCASIFLVLSAGTAPTAFAADDNASAVLADCGAPDLPSSAVDSCLERARVVDETDPSPQLQSLEAQLEQREAGPRTAHRQPRPLQTPANSASSEMVPDSQPTVVESERDLPPAAAEPDQGRPAATEEAPTRMTDERPSEQQRSTEAGADRPPAGIDDDLPPIADPPDDDAPSGRTSDLADDPQ